MAVAVKRPNKIRKLLGYTSFYLTSFIKTLFGKYDVVYIHYPSYSAIAVLLAHRLRRRKLIVNVHGSDVLPLNDNQRRLEKNTRKAISMADKVVVPSIYFKQVVHEKYTFPLERIEVYPSGGIDSHVFFQYQEKDIIRVRKELGLDKKKFTVGFISRLYKEKGWKTFVNAIEKLKEYSDQMQFLVVGSGPDEDQLSKLIEDKQLGGMVYRFPAQPQERLADFYNILDIFAFPTAAAESLGLVAIEAMGCGVPVIASDFAAPKYYIKDGFNGYKFELKNSDDLAAKIEHVFKTRDTIDDLKEGALSTAEAYNSTNCCKTLRRILDY